MNVDESVLALFHSELSVPVSFSGKVTTLKLDTVLQDYAEADELVYAIDKYHKHFNVDISMLNLNNYYPWHIEWFFKKWFKKESRKHDKLPLTVRMFAESATAGRWLFD